MKKNGQTYYFHLNQRGDVIKITDSSQTVVATYSYDPWGNILSESGSFANDQPFRYASYYWDSEIGMYYLINRYYDPVIGRFISKDPASDPEDSALDPQEMNPYTYAANNPVMATDPDGLNPMLKPGDSDATYVPLAKAMLINIARYVAGEANYAAYITNAGSAGYGPGLEQAVNAFKSARGLTADGQIGNAVWQLLYSGNSQAQANAAAAQGSAPPPATGGVTAQGVLETLDWIAEKAVRLELAGTIGTEQIAFPHSGNATRYLRTVLQVNAGYGRGHRVYGIANLVGEAAKYVWFYEMVKSGGPWDLKRAEPEIGPQNRAEKFLQFRRRKISPDDFGNIHFGYVGRALDIPLDTLLLGSGFANKYLGGDKPSSGEGIDQRWVRRGYQLYGKRWGGWTFTQTSVYIRT